MTIILRNTEGRKYIVTCPMTDIIPRHKVIAKAFILDPVMRGLRAD
jgi:hypothetical protein